MTSEPNARINEIFPHKVCINLNRRPERWQQMQRRFAHHGIHSIRRFPAIDGENQTIPANWRNTPGAYGCLLSHLQVVSEARLLGLPGVLIFEDDTVFDQDFANKFHHYIQQLPLDWDMLFLGALHKDEPIKVSENISRITRANSTYAYALRNTVFDEFIELNRAAADVLDINNFDLQNRFNCYCFMPNLAWVEAGYSDAQTRFEHHWYLEQSLVLFGSQVDRLLANTTVVIAHSNERAGNANQNLMFLVNYYHAFFSPHIAIVIVEQGREPSVDTAKLPGACKHIFLRDEHAFDRELCFKKGITAADPRRKLFILSDHDVYLETLDIRANLLMCERYDCATGFRRIIDLSKETSRTLRATRTTRGIDITKDNLSPKTSSRGYCCFLSRETIRDLDAALKEIMHPSSSDIDQELKIFESPNHALRLS